MTPAELEEQRRAKKVRKWGAGLFGLGLLLSLGAITGEVSQWIPYALFSATSLVGLRLLISGSWA